MLNLLQGHLDQVLTLVLAAAVLYLLWSQVIARDRRRTGGGTDYSCLVFCKHCNWEGVVRRSKYQCNRCHSLNIATLTV